MNEINFKHISLYKSPEESPGYLLWRVSTQWRSSIEKVLKPLDLTHPQFVVLATLAWLTKEGNKVSQIDVGRMAALDPNSTSQILRGLEAKKFIKRKHSIDERSKNPVLTELGSTTLAQAMPAVEQADIQFFARLTDNQIKTIVPLFQTLMR
ncbi:MAG: MarR family winged helix-turn-helix transcriptional regulator [Candidatus Babeliales bacterium]